jgi:maltooligosyltrehalose trehalohydrolase
MRTDPLSWRRLPIGAEPDPSGGTHFRVWAPRRRSVAVVDEAGVRSPLAREEDGYFSGTVETTQPGAAYRFLLDDDGSFPDPASRFQPDGPHGPSIVVDPTRFQWTDAAWRGVPDDERVLYEMHVGTFTRDGTWESAMAELPALADLGITLVELMPVNEFAGRFGWGYDGVDLFAPTRLYGTPDDFRRFVDRAHALGMGVMLDVVYNHLGPDGNYLRQFADEYFSTRYTTDWGEAINFDGPGAEPVRELFVANARYWIEEFHLDGLRLDASQNVYDTSASHILREVAAAARLAAPSRTTFIVAENEPQDARLVRHANEGGLGLDALWNDDWHHSAAVALTGRNEAYYLDYRGCASEFVAAAKYGFLFQGQWYTWQEQPRGHLALDLPPRRFVHFLENHDQIANSFRGDRLHALAGAARWRAMTALLLLGPQIPMLFQGQEFNASAPFLYFADHVPELMVHVRRGRGEFLEQFQSIASRPDSVALPDPGDPATFERSKLDHDERVRHASAFRFHRDLLTLRRTDPVLRPAARARVDGAVLSEDAFALRYFGPSDDARLLLLNLGAPLAFGLLPEPLLAPPTRDGWRVVWSSEGPEYDGLGTPTIPPHLHGWCMPGNSAVLLAPCPAGESPSNEGGDD